MAKETIKFKPSHKMKIDDIGDYLSKVNRGTGSPKPKKGKGSYRRKPKHRNGEW